MERLIYKAPERVDARNAKKVEKELQELAGNDGEIVFDMAELKYISSAGLRILLNLQKKLMPTGGDVFVSNVPEAVTEILDITGFSSFISTI